MQSTCVRSIDDEVESAVRAWQVCGRVWHLRLGSQQRAHVSQAFGGGLKMWSCKGTDWVVQFEPQTSPIPPAGYCQHMLHAPSSSAPPPQAENAREFHARLEAI